jgi:hypothetical protein
VRAGRLSVATGRHATERCVDAAELRFVEETAIAHHSALASDERKGGGFYNNVSMHVFAGAQNWSSAPAGYEYV